METIGLLLGSSMLLLLFLAWWSVGFSIFTKKQEVVSNDTVEKMPVVDENLEETGEFVDGVVTEFEVDATDAELINYGAAVLIISKAFALAVTAAVWYFIFSPLFF